MIWEGIISLLFLIGFAYLAILFIMAIIRRFTNWPTWTGIIISAILGMLPFYLFLCFFGILGAKRNKPSDDTQSAADTYAEKMSRRYAYYDSHKRKKWGWFKYVALFYVVMYFIFYRPSDSDEQEVVAPVETVTTDSVVVEEQKEETPAVVKKKTPVKKQETKPKRSNPEMEKPLVREEEHLFIDHSPLPEMKIPQDNNAEVIDNEKSTLELLEERNHANVVKQAKEAGVSTEGSTIDILERINHANVVKQAKEAGVSTEGSTIDILERINHANVVKQAKEAGVSTEGSTLDILERIHRKQLEKYLK